MGYRVPAPKMIKIPIYELGNPEAVAYVNGPDASPIEVIEECRFCGRIREDGEIVCNGCGGAY
jgi:hypothetical protein